MTVIAASILGFLIGRLAGGFAACARCERRHLAELEIVEQRWAGVVQDVRRQAGRRHRRLIRQAYKVVLMNRYLRAGRENVGQGEN